MSQELSEIHFIIMDGGRAGTGEAKIKKCPKEKGLDRTASIQWAGRNQEKCL